MEMNFINVNELIEIVKAHRQNTNAWIFENGKLKDNIITCDILKFLEEYFDEAVDVGSEVFTNVQGMSYNFDSFKPFNNYNNGSNSSEVIEYHTFEDDWDFYVAISVHIGMDVRCGYTNFVLFRFDSFADFWGALDQTYYIEEEDFSASIVCNGLIEDSVTYVNYTNDDGEDCDLDLSTYGFEREEIVEYIRNVISEIKSEKEN